MGTEISGSTGIDKIQNNAVDIADLSATGTASASTFLCGNNTWAEAGGGKVLQVVSDTNTVQQVVSSQSWVDTGLSLSLTPSSTSSKVHLQFNFQNIHVETINTGVSFRFVRNGISIDTPAAGYASYASSAHHWAYGDIALDLPATTSAITYKIQVRGYNTTAFKLNYSGQFKDNLIAMEIGA